MKWQELASRPIRHRNLSGWLTLKPSVLAPLWVIAQANKSSGLQPNACNYFTRCSLFLKYIITFMDRSYAACSSRCAQYEREIPPLTGQPSFLVSVSIVGARHPRPRPIYSIALLQSGRQVYFIFYLLGTAQEPNILNVITN